MEYTFCHFIIIFVKYNKCPNNLNWFKILMPHSISLAASMNLEHSIKEGSHERYHYITLVRIGFLLEVDGVTCGSAVLVVSLSCSDTCGISDTHGVSGTHGTSDTCGISGTHGASDTFGISGTHGTSGICGASVVGSMVPISGFVSALTFSF